VPSNRVPKIEVTFCNTIYDTHKHIKAGAVYQFGTTTHAPHKIESNPGGEAELLIPKFTPMGYRIENSASTHKIHNKPITLFFFV